MVAHHLPLPIVKVCHRDEEEPAIIVAAVSGQVAAAAQLQLADSQVAKLMSSFSPARPLVVLICAIPWKKIGEGEGNTWL